MKNFTSKNIKELQALTGNYHATQANFLASAKGDDKDKMISLMGKLTKIEDLIMENLSSKASAVNENGSWMVKFADGNYALLSPVENRGLVKFELTKVSQDQASKFETEEAVNAEVSPINFATFRCYINGAGKTMFA